MVVVYIIRECKCGSSFILSESVSVVVLYIIRECKCDSFLYYQRV